MPMPPALCRAKLGAAGGHLSTLVGAVAWKSIDLLHDYQPCSKRMLLGTW